MDDLVTLASAVRRAIPSAPLSLQHDCVDRLRTRWNYRAPDRVAIGECYGRAMRAADADALMVSWVPWALRKIREKADRVVRAVDRESSTTDTDDATWLAVETEPQLLEDFCPVLD